MSDPDPLNRFLFRHTTWLGLGTDTEETDYPGYARQRITLTAEIRFPRLLGFLSTDVTHLQVWTEETGGEMLAIGKLPQPLHSGDDLVVPPNTLFY